MMKQTMMDAILMVGTAVVQMSIQITAQNANVSIMKDQVEKMEQQPHLLQPTVEDVLFQTMLEMVIVMIQQIMLNVTLILEIAVDLASILTIVPIAPVLEVLITMLRRIIPKMLYWQMVSVMIKQTT